MDLLSNPSAQETSLRGKYKRSGAPLNKKQRSLYIHSVARLEPLFDTHGYSFMQTQFTKLAEITLLLKRRIPSQISLYTYIHIYKITLTSSVV